MKHQIEKIVYRRSLQTLYITYVQDDGQEVTLILSVEDIFTNYFLSNVLKKLIEPFSLDKHKIIKSEGGEVARTIPLAQESK